MLDDSYDVLIIIPVFNEEKFLLKALNSVKNQTYNNIKIIVSDNYSTDDSKDILLNFVSNDNRFELISPPGHLNGIDHLRFLVSYSKSKSKKCSFLSFIGAHDIWMPNYIQSLVDLMNKEQRTVLAYTPVGEIDEHDNVIKVWNSSVVTNDADPVFRPFQVLLGLTHNVCFGGLWRKDTFYKSVGIKKVPFSAIDHFEIARAALDGSISLCNESHMYLRKMNDSGNMEKYKEKHLSKDISVFDDMKMQLMAVDELMNEAKNKNEGLTFYKNQNIFNILNTNMKIAYLIRYFHVASGWSNGINDLFNDPRILKILKMSLEIDNEFKSLLND